MTPTDNATFYFLICLLKFEVKKTLHGVWLFSGATYRGEEETKGRREDTDHQTLSDNLPVPGSSNLNLSFSGAQQKVLC